MFHFPGCPPHELLIHSWVTGHCPGRVPPFGYSRINAYLQLPWTFRSLSRPSSAISALASTLRSYSLDLASSVIPFLRLLRCNDSLMILSSASSASDFSLPRSPLLSECLPCAVFKVRARPFGQAARSFGQALSFRFREPSKRYRITSFSQYINWSYSLLRFRFACLPCHPAIPRRIST